jgi:hypothetical protein
MVLGSLSGGMRNSRNLPYEVMKGTMSEASWDDTLEMVLRARCKSLVTSFSISFVLDDMIRLKHLGIPVYGCGYLYDDVDSKGVLVDSLGVLMKLVSPSKAHVQWGTDVAYEETPVMKKDLALHFSLIKAVDLVPLDSFHMSKECAQICDKVYIVLG